MNLSAESKKEIIGKFKKHEKDTGAAEVQIALLTEKVNQLTGHLKGHAKDYSTRRGLLMLVGKRASLLKYLNAKSPDRYKAVISALGLRK